MRPRGRIDSHVVRQQWAVGVPRSELHWGILMCEHEGDRNEEIDDFIRWCDQPYDDYMDLTAGRAEEIARKYFTPFGNLTDDAVHRMLAIMRRSIERNPTRKGIREWKGCCVGVAHYLFRPADLAGANRQACARALQRFSGWYHAGTPLWVRFREEAAEQIGNMLYCLNFLRYLKIGEEWTFDPSRLDSTLMTKNGLMFLWAFAHGIPNAVRTEAKLDAETKTLASRLLNFLCERNYSVHVTADTYQEIVANFPNGNTQTLPPSDQERDRHPLLRWSINGKFVDLITKRLVVSGPNLLSYLQRSRFNPDVTYNPNGDDRLAWFHTWNVAR